MTNIFGFTPTQLLGFTVLGSIVTVIGNLLATALKDFFFARSFERWKERRALMSVYRKYRDPIVLACQELRSRLTQIYDSFPPDYLMSEVLDIQSDMLKTNSSDDPHYKKYRLLSTVYRFCAFLGWLELYRQDLTFLDIGRQEENSRFEKALGKLRGALADGRLNGAPDWQMWRDGLIFREEQRAIGEAMIANDASPRVVIGYRAFCALFTQIASDESLWPLRVACNFFLDLEERNDFRRKRIEIMREELGNLVDILRASRP